MAVMTSDSPAPEEKKSPMKAEKPKPSNAMNQCLRWVPRWSVLRFVRMIIKDWWHNSIFRSLVVRIRLLNRPVEVLDEIASQVIEAIDYILDEDQVDKADVAKVVQELKLPNSPVKKTPSKNFLAPPDPQSSSKISICSL